MPSILDTTELQEDTMATYVFAMGDSRAYTRVLFPALVGPKGSQRACTVEDILALGAQLDTLTESKLIAVTMSVLYDESNIPMGDNGIEDTCFALLRSGKSAFQLRIPNTAGLDKGEVFAAVGAYIFEPTTGYPVDACVNTNNKQDKRARMSV